MIYLRLSRAGKAADGAEELLDGRGNDRDKIANAPGGGVETKMSSTPNIGGLLQASTPGILGPLA